jgi:hypothetical protein
MRFDLTEVSCALGAELAVHCVFENIAHGPELGQRSQVLATNVYKSTERGWRILLHHASPSVALQPRSTLH